MMKQILVLAIILIANVYTHEVASKQELKMLMNLVRKLQVAPKPKAPVNKGDNGSHPKSWENASYTYDAKLGGPGVAQMVSHPFPKANDTWSASRSDWYKAEAARLYAERTFHTAELKRYHIQKDLNEQRRKIETDSSTSLKDKFAALKKLDQKFRVPIVEQDTKITRVQVLRNPLNVKAAQAKREFSAKQRNAVQGWKQALSKSESGSKRRLQNSRDAQAANLFTDRYNKFKAQYDLNFIFHKSEFVEFARDEQRLEDSRDNWEDANASLVDKQMRQRSIDKKWGQERRPIKQLINNNNNARKRAQRTKNTAERAVRNFYRRNRRSLK